MKIRRCAVLFIEPREALKVSWAGLFSGGSTLSATLSWTAMAPHLGREVEVDAGEVKVLGEIGPTIWTEQSDCETRFGQAMVARLLELGLLVGDDVTVEATRERDDTLRSQHWHNLSALAHTFGRWADVRVDTGMQVPSFKDLVAKYGLPPAPAINRCAPGLALQLPAPAGGALDDTLFRRYTGRNFDLQAALPLAVAARILQRSFGAQETRLIGDDSYVFKKTSPSGGALHPIEAYVLVQRIEGVDPGLYHYHPVDHTLEPVQAMNSAQAAALATQLVAEQQWFADAPMQVIMTARVERNFWKYRNHLKALKAVVLDGGHLSQTFYLLSTEAGLAAFVTTAVNDVDIERVLGLDHLRDAVIGVCGCGPAGPQRDTVELRFGETDFAGRV
jgi:putative peptide maturation dehydrogenase